MVSSKQSLLALVQNFLLELLYPSYCLSCHSQENFLCHACYHRLEFAWSPPDLREQEKTLGQIYFDQLQVLAGFRPPFSQLVKALKYRGGKNLAPFLAQMLQQHLIIPQIDYLTFIPLHPDKLRIRGYNQCQVVAVKLGELSHLPVKNLLERRVYSQAQATIKDPQLRLQRMAAAFQVRPKYKNFITGKNILLLDDIFTTGATVNAAAKVLKEAGVRKIQVMVLASKKT